jgi:hypothetical protein
MLYVLGSAFKYSNDAYELYQKKRVNYSYQSSLPYTYSSSEYIEGTVTTVPSDSTKTAVRKNLPLLSVTFFNFKDYFNPYILLSWFFLILKGLVFLIEFDLLRRFFNQVTESTIFATQNVRRLRYLAYLCFAHPLFTWLSYFFEKQYFEPRLTIPNISLSAVHQVSYTMINSYYSIYIGLTILGLVEIFRLAAHIQKENELTI